MFYLWPKQPNCNTPSRAVLMLLCKKACHNVGRLVDALEAGERKITELNKRGDSRIQATQSQNVNLIKMLSNDKERGKKKREGVVCP